MSVLFLGVDGGQSGTVALIADEHGEILGRGAAGPCNHVASAEAEMKLARVVRECVDGACSSGHLAVDTQFQSACFGMSGGPNDKERVLRQTVAARTMLVTDDAVIALSGALTGQPGVIVIGGTGSIALGRGPDGTVCRTGGWGYIFGDEGSAFDIVRQALRACLRAEEGWGPATQLSGVFLSATGCIDLNSVLHLFYTPEWPRSRVATLAKEVDACAGEGDSIARQLLTNAAQSLAVFAQSIVRQCWPEEAEVTCSYAGGVFHSPLILNRFHDLLALTNCSVVAPALGPACGALIEAYRALGVAPDFGKLLSSKFGHE